MLLGDVRKQLEGVVRVGAVPGVLGCVREVLLLVGLLVREVLVLVGAVELVGQSSRRKY